SFHFLFVRIIVNAWIEGLGLPGNFQILSQLPSLKDVLDFSHEGRDLGPEVRIVVSGFKEIDELLADQISQGLVGSKLIFNASGGIALLNPNFAEAHGRFRCPRSGRPPNSCKPRLRSALA